MIRRAVAMLLHGSVKPIRPAPGRRRRRPLILALMVLCGIYWIATTPNHRLSTWSGASPSSPRTPASSERFSGSNVKPAEAVLQVPVSAPTPPSAASRKDLVVASMLGDNTTWLYEQLPDWRKNVFVVDDKTAELTVVRNKGRESMVYLTYVLGFHQGKKKEKEKNLCRNTDTNAVTSLTTTTIYRTTCSLYTRSDINGTTTTRTTTAPP